MGNQESLGFKKELAPTIPLAYEEAFEELGQKLIFNKPFDLRVSRENIGLISRKIQDEFIDLEDENQRLMRNHLHRLISHIKIVDKDGELALDNSDSDEEFVEPDYESVFNQIINTVKTDEEFLERITHHYVGTPVYDDSHKYYGWGFTPKLAKRPSEDFKESGIHEISRNCLGTVIGLGAYLNKKGFTFDMGITPDHPFAVVYLNNEIYFADIGGLKKINGKLEDHGSYKIYRPVDEDKILQHIIIIQNFDDSVLYEVLENMEVLRRMSLGDNVANLPNTKDEGLKIAEENKDTLQKINWKDLQARLFPEIVKSFIENKEEWSKEVDYIVQQRPQQYAQNIFFTAAMEAQRKTSFADKSFQEGQIALLDEFKKYNTDIVDFMRKGIPFKEAVPEDTKNFFLTLKNEIIKEKNQETIELVNQLIEKRIIDNPIEK